jgi:hypothetical protein
VGSIGDSPDADDAGVVGDGGGTGPGSDARPPPD